MHRLRRRRGAADAAAQHRHRPPALRVHRVPAVHLRRRLVRARQAATGGRTSSAPAPPAWSASPALYGVLRSHSVSRGRLTARTSRWTVGLLALIAYVPALLTKPGSHARRHEAVPVPRPGPPHRRRAVHLGHPPVRRLGAAPDHRLPVAAGPVVLGVRPARRARLGGPPAVDRHAAVPGGAGACYWAARLLGLPKQRRAGRRRRLPAVAVHPAVRVAHQSAMLLPWAAVGWLVGLTIRVGDQRAPLATPGADGAGAAVVQRGRTPPR